MRLHKTHSLGLDKQTIQTYIDTFFSYLYPTSFLGFLHRGLFLRAWHTHTLNPTLLKAVCACTAQYTSDSSRASEWIQEVEIDVLQNMGDLSTIRLQVMLLLLYYYGSRRSSKAWMLSALAVRLAFAKRFNYEQESMPETTRESQRRLMWSLFIVDRLYSGGLTEFTLCPREPLHIRLPCNERLFTLGIPSQSPKLHACDGQEHMGVLSCYIRLLDIRHDILSYTKSVIMNDVKLWDSRLRLRDLEKRLSDFAVSLPIEMRWTSDNLMLRAYTPNLDRFIMLHTFWHQCHCDLYRLPIRGIKESISDQALAETPRDYAMLLSDRCLDSAWDLVRLWTQILDLGLDNPIKDFSVSGCAYQCAKIVATTTYNGVSSLNAECMRPPDAVKICLKILESIKSAHPVVGRVVSPRVHLCRR
ncbi:hypothetical protein D6D18_08506 [Aureobasidium pullulans]|nr:hypothetical protein D6D18_08506 [Aureobasidium pullulans]